MSKFITLVALIILCFISKAQKPNIEFPIYISGFFTEESDTVWLGLSENATPSFDVWLEEIDTTMKDSLGVLAFDENVANEFNHSSFFNMRKVYKNYDEIDQGLNEPLRVSYDVYFSINPEYHKVYTQDGCYYQRDDIPQAYLHFNPLDALQQINAAIENEPYKLSTFLFQSSWGYFESTYLTVSSLSSNSTISNQIDFLDLELIPEVYYFPLVGFFGSENFIIKTKISLFFELPVFIENENSREIVIQKIGRSVQIKNLEGDEMVQIYNISGQLLYQQKNYQNILSFSLPQISNSIISIVITDAEGGTNSKIFFYE